MRSAFIEKLELAMANDPLIYVLTADLGFRVFEGIKDKFPHQYTNVGVCEANMIGVAAGLAMNGFKVFVYSTAPFVTSRCYEQIKNSICYDNLNIKIIGVGGGFSYGAQGVTHHSVEDVAIMRALPNMAVVCPADKNETAAIADLIINHTGPLYLRLGRNYEIDQQFNQIDLKLGWGIVYQSQGEVAIFSTGNILNLSLEVFKELSKQGIKARVISLPIVKPLDKELILKTAQEVKAIFTLEENSIIGGLGSAVADILAEGQSKVIFKKFGLPDKFIRDVGSQDYLRDKAGLSAETVVKEIKRLI